LRAKQQAARLKVLEAHRKFSQLMRLPIADESGQNEAEILQLTEELLKDLPPNDGLRREVQFRREHALAMKARREHQSPSGAPSPNATVSPAPARPPAPVPAPTA
jgi:hypothetical protein